MAKHKTVKVRDKIQKKYQYILSQPIGKNFHPEFKPELTPKEMLNLGVFGGRNMRDCGKEFTKSWFEKAKFHKLGELGHDKKLNFFKINASQSFSVWKAKGWLYKEDPRGWFQWHCRYYMGRRIANEDLKQIKRWIAMRRHISQLMKNCKSRDFFCEPRRRQALLHWAYDSRRM